MIPKLIEIQSKLKAHKGQFNKFGGYAYRSCEDILEAVKPLLAEAGLILVITDEVKTEGALTFIEATAELIDPAETGDHKAIRIKAQAGIDPNRKGMDIAQSFGSSSSYARKYALNGLFLIDDTKDADATNDHGRPAPKPKAAKKKAVQQPDPRPDAYDEMETIFCDHLDTVTGYLISIEWLKDGQTLRDLSAQHAAQALGKAPGLLKKALAWKGKYA